MVCALSLDRFNRLNKNNNILNTMPEIAASIKSFSIPNIRRAGSSIDLQCCGQKTNNRRSGSLLVWVGELNRIEYGSHSHSVYLQLKNPFMVTLPYHYCQMTQTRYGWPEHHPPSRQCYTLSLSNEVPERRVLFIESGGLLNIRIHDDS